MSARRRIVRLAVAFGLAAAICAACADEPRPPPNVLLVIIDTLRADHVGSYGQVRETTPALDAFAEGAVRFDRAYATAPWTQPSVASILTGLEPGRHGLRSFGSLPDGVDTLAERLRDQGYQTAAIVSHVLLARRFGFDQGFGTFLVASALPAHERESTSGVTRNAVALLQSFAQRSPPHEPFFLLVHYFDPHYRYLPHDDADFAAPGAGRLLGGEDIVTLREMMADASDEEIGFVVDLYDEEIRHTDAGVGRVLAALSRLGLDDDTLVVVTADHGEELMERGWLGHTRTLYDELVRVPLLVRPPGGMQAGRVVGQPVSLASLAATILDYAGVPADGDASSRAPSLRPLLAGRAAGEEESVLIEVDFTDDGSSKDTHKKALVVGDEKLIRDDETGRLELYDIADDPLERNDLARERAARTEALAALLDRRLAAEGRLQRDASPVEPSGAQRLQLEALGYLQPESERSPRR